VADEELRGRESRAKPELRAEVGSGSGGSGSTGSGSSKTLGVVDVTTH
jgi:hypothetical protein